MTPEYRTVGGRIRQEVSEFRSVVDRASRSFEKPEQSTDDRFVDAAAFNLHGYYSGVERVFEHIARHIDESVPTGHSWRVDLLRQMATTISDVRPAVISDELRQRLDRYRGFRHVVRNVHTHNLDAELVRLLVRDLPDTHKSVEGALCDFADFLEGGGEFRDRHQ